ncbi:MAG: tetratricopeptide repeat protein [Chloroflexi bacterium]|nr:tetratricopeptide repeat protein [Chloroflexota bacterium]
MQESLSNYSGAIREYEKAAEINPRLTFLYISIGANLRQLGQHDRALEYFAKAVDINKQIGVKDPIPYLSIAKTYSQMGEFFAAAANVQRALEFNPSSADIYGQLGIVYFKSRNYEGAIPALLCAVRGCDAATSCDVRFCDAGVDPSIEIQGLPLTINTAVYYYTYGSVLAGMHRQSNNYCEEAMKVLGEVRKAFSEDPTIITIIEPSEQICEGYGYTRR